MQIKRIATMPGGQDGAIWGNLLFRFNARGEGKVYDLETVKEGAELTEDMWSLKKTPASKHPDLERIATVIIVPQPY